MCSQSSSSVACCGPVFPLTHGHFFSVFKYITSPQNRYSYFIISTVNPWILRNCFPWKTKTLFISSSWHIDSSQFSWLLELCIPIITKTNMLLCLRFRLQPESDFTWHLPNHAIRSTTYNNYSPRLSQASHSSPLNGDTKSSFVT